MKKALISGITGQDGSFLAEFLLQRDMKYMALYGAHHLSIQAASSICTLTNGYVT